MTPSLSTSEAPPASVRAGRRSLLGVAGVPRPLLGALAAGAAFLVFLTVDQSHWWGLRPDYAFGWLAPVFCCYVAYLRWPELLACATGSFIPTQSAGRLPARSSWSARLATVSAALCLFAGAGIFLLGALYRGGAGASQPGSLALAAGFALLFPSLIFLNVPAGAARFRAASLFFFPAVIWLLSAPLLTAVENAISLALLRRVVSVVFTVFNLLGLPLVQEGNVLVLPKGQVGVADACSGIRSLTGCLFAGSFLAAVFLDRGWKKILLVAAALMLAFLTNLLRSLFLTAWAYAYGSDAIEGRLHDATGFAVLGLTCVGLFCLLPLFRSRTAGPAVSAG